MNPAWINSMTMISVLYLRNMVFQKKTAIQQVPPGPIAVRIVCPGSVLNGHDVFLLRFDDLFYFLRVFVRELLDVLFGPFGIVF